MKIKKLLIVIPLLFSSLISADFRQGVDYRLVNSPLPVKKDALTRQATFPRRRSGLAGCIWFLSIG